MTPITMAYLVRPAAAPKTGDHPIQALANREFPAYTDLLLHDMGPGLADLCQGLVATPAAAR